MIDFTSRVSILIQRLFSTTCLTVYQYIALRRQSQHFFQRFLDFWRIFFNNRGGDVKTSSNLWLAFDEESHKSIDFLGKVCYNGGNPAKGGF